MSKDIDLTEILKNCPRGAKFYSYIFGEDTHFMGVSSHQGDARPIFIYGKYGEGQNFCLTRKGHAYADNYGECCIFPSKDQRDWSKFTAPWYKKEKKVKPERFDPKTLNVFDKVLARVYLGAWFADFVSVPGDDELCDIPSLVGSSNFNEVIPYNDETKHLLGTTDDAPDYYQYVDEDEEWEDED